MKVIIPCAGYATRLFPLTKNKPKSLLDVKGKPMIEHIIKRIEELDVDEIFIITNNKFYPNFKEWLHNFSSKIPIKLLNDKTTSNENRLGAVGDINFVMNEKKIDDDLLIVNGDNLFNFSLKDVYEFFRKKRRITNALYDTKNWKTASEQGTALVNRDNKIMLFEEKAKKPKTTTVSLGIYFFPREKVRTIKEFVDEGNNPDKIGDFIIWLLAKEDIYAYVYHEKWFDIGWKESLEYARKEFKP